MEDPQSHLHTALCAVLTLSTLPGVLFAFFFSPTSSPLSASQIPAASASMDNHHHPPFLNEDLLLQILSRLPKKSLHRFKSVSKEWHAIMSTPHRFPRLASDSGFLLQSPSSRDSLRASFFRILPNGSPIYHLSLLFAFRSSSNSLSVRPSSSSDSTFLPTTCSNLSQSRKFSIAASCNGFIFLLRRLVFGNASYVYDPRSNLSVSLPPPSKNPTASVVGLAVEGTHYHVVFLSLIPHPSGNPYLLFEIYSSNTGRWRHTAVRSFSADLPDSQTAVFVKGYLHWLWGEHLLVFRLSDDCHQIVELPKLHGFTTTQTKTCIWEAEGSLHYCDGSLHRIRIWVLLSEGWFYRRKRRGFGWKLKHDIMPRISCDSPDIDVCCKYSFPCGFNEDFEILYLWAEGDGESALLCLSLVSGLLREVGRYPSLKFQEIFPFFYGGVAESFQKKK